MSEMRLRFVDGDLVANFDVPTEEQAELEAMIRRDLDAALARPRGTRAEEQRNWERGAVRLVDMFLVAAERVGAFDRPS